MQQNIALREKLINWVLFTLLSIIWGSSFILMKLGLETLSPYQVATLRMLSAGIILIPFALEGFRKIQKKEFLYVILSGLLGSFFPAYLFCIAETKIDSSIAGILNALTPLFTISVGVFFFQMNASKQKIIGVLVGFVADGRRDNVPPNGAKSTDSARQMACRRHEQPRFSSLWLHDVLAEHRVLPCCGGAVFKRQSFGCHAQS